PVLIQDAQLEFMDDRSVRRAGLVHRQTEKTTGGGAPVETVVVAVAGRDVLPLPKTLAIVGQVHGEDGAVRFAPLDQHAKQRTRIAEINRNALAAGESERCASQR